MTIQPHDAIRARNAAGVWILVPVADIFCISADDDETDCTLLTLRDESVVTLPEAYEEVLDRIVTSWSDHK